MKRFFLLFAAGLILSACGGPAADQAADTRDEHSAAETVLDHPIAELVNEPIGFEGRTVRIEGVIDHMCRHSGDKMRVAQMDDSQMSIQVRLGDLMNQFSQEMEGSQVAVTGVFKVELVNMEELDHHDDGHDCESTTEAIALMEQRGIDPNIRPYIELQVYEIK